MTLPSKVMTSQTLHAQHNAHPTHNPFDIFLSPARNSLRIAHDEKNSLLCYCDEVIVKHLLVTYKPMSEAE